MAIHKPVTAPGIYFITFTCYRWLSLIEFVDGYDIVYKWFDVITAKGHSITGYVIMPNHIHLLLHYAGGHSSLNRVIGNGKRFMAYEIIKRLERLKKQELLTMLQLAVSSLERNRGKKHEVWEDSVDIKSCRTEKFILQKLHYTHNNPCSGKWKLADNPLHYQHSSASFYISGKRGNYPVRDYRDFIQFDHSED